MWSSRRVPTDDCNRHGITPRRRLLSTALTCAAQPWIMALSRPSGRPQIQYVPPKRATGLCTGSPFTPAGIIKISSAAVRAGLTEPSRGGGEMCPETRSGVCARRRPAIMWCLPLELSSWISQPPLSSETHPVDRIYALSLERTLVTLSSQSSMAALCRYRPKAVRDTV